MRAVDARQQLADEGMAGLVERDDTALVLVERAPRLDARDDPLDGGVEVALRQRDALAAGAPDGRLVAEVRELGAAQPARLAREDAEIDVVDRLVAGVDVEDREAAATSGGETKT